ncbi:hypothetical protein [Pseudomonas lutea]|nr:hypothetical protein [Pseudomonas lutea]
MAVDDDPAKVPGLLFDGLIPDEVPIKFIGVNPSQLLDTTVG